MSNNNIEIEIQVSIEKSQPLVDFLEKNGAFQGEKHQIDQYFTPAHRNFLANRPVGEWLRLRDANSKYSINYKNWHFDERGKSYYADEYETAVEDLQKAKKIFEALNMTPVALVDKVRKIWHYNDYEVTLDAVKDLGNFVEIEYIGNDSAIDPIKITAEMVRFLKDVGCGKIIRNYVGYPFLLLFPNEVEYEEQ